MSLPNLGRIAPSLLLGSGAFLMLASGCSDCACDYAGQTTVIPIAQDDYRRLLTLYGPDGVPVDECQLRCLRGDEKDEPPLTGSTSSTATGTGGADGSGGSGNGGAGVGGAGAAGEGGAGGDSFAARNYDVDSCKLTTIRFDEGAVECTFVPSCGGAGRRPHRLVAPRSRGGSTVGSYLARAAHLEAASVVAFVDLARELALHGGADDLVRASLRSAKEEARHARVMTRLAIAAGVRPEPVRVRPFEPRSLEAIAIHNAEEGCAGEAFGAALLRAQAVRSHSASFRVAASSIAADELRHAAFSLELGARLGARLGAGVRRRARDARVEAFSRIAREHEQDASREEGRLLGVPSAERLQDLVRSVERFTARAGA